MPRSLKVRRESIATVKSAVSRSGYSTQRMLAEDLEISLSTLSNFLTGKPVDLAIFEEICGKLSLEANQVVEPSELPDLQTETQRVAAQQDWGEAPDVSVFYDRVNELEIRWKAGSIQITVV